MIDRRLSSDRGSADYGWLKTSYTFSFAEYYDPKFMGFRCLRVINEDLIAPGGGFPTHGHRDMEILTYVTLGVLEHRDSLGNTAQIKPGMIQKMSAGHGIRHSEYNPSLNEATHLFQIWIEPSELGINPSYGERNIESELKGGSLVLIASPTGEKNSMKLHQDAKIFVGQGATFQSEVYPIEESRHVWIQVLKGTLLVNGVPLNRSDGVAISNEESIRLERSEDSEFLLFDLP